MEGKTDMTSRVKSMELPDDKGYFGPYGGSFVPPQLQSVLDEITDAYMKIKNEEGFLSELQSLYEHYVGRPSPVFHARGLSEKLGGAQIYLKREDLNHTGAHKINRCLGEALLAKKMEKKTLIAETGGGTTRGGACNGGSARGAYM